MTSPTPPDLSKEGPSAPAAPASKPKLRPGQLVTFRHPDPVVPGEVIEGHGLVLKVTDDGGAATIAPLSLLHLYTAADNVAPVKVEDVPTSIQQPEPETSA